MSKISVEKKPNFQFRNLTFIKSQAEELNQIENTVLMESVFDEYKQLVKLGCVLSKTQYGFTASSKDVGNSKLLRITDLNEGSINWDTVPFCDCNEVEKYKINDGDILIARTGGTTGKTVLINKIDVDSVFASYLIRLSVGKEYNPEYVYIFLNSYLFWNQILEMKNGTAQPNVNAEKMKELKIPYCPLDIQNEIVFYKNKKNLSTSLLHQVNKKINRLKAQYVIHQSLISENVTQSKTFTKLRQAILQEAIEGKLTADWRVKNPVEKGNPDFDAQALLETIKAEKQKLMAEGKIKKEKPLAPINPDDVPFALPDGWVWVRLGEVLELISDYHANGSYEILKENVELLEAEDFAIMLRTTNFSEKNFNNYKYISEKAYHFLSKSQLFAGDIIMNKIGDPGATYLVENRGKPMSLAMNLFVLRFPSKNMNNKFSFLYLNSKYDYIKSFANGTATQTITKDAVNKLFFPLPPLAEQHAIVERVDRLLESVNALEQQVTERKTYAEQLMQAVLKEAFAG